MLHAERFTATLIATIHDPVLRNLPLTGAIDQFVDSTDALGNRTLTQLFARAIFLRRLKHGLAGLSPDEHEQAGRRQHDPVATHPEPHESS